MKKQFTLIGIIILMISCSSTKNILKNNIPQSEPFINVLTALKNDSVPIFVSAFSKRIIDGETDNAIWKKRLNEGKKRFKSRIGDFKIKDFSYNFDEEASKLIIIFKEEEMARMKVVFEDNKWRLDEK